MYGRLCVDNEPVSGLNVIQVRRWCAVGSYLGRTSGRCARRWEDGGLHRMKSHRYLKPTKTPPPPVITRSRTLRPHIVPLREHRSNPKMKRVKDLGLSLLLSQTPRNVQGTQKPLASLNRAQGRTARWRKTSGAGTQFLMRPTTCWTGCWTWTLPPGSQPLRPCSTHCSKTCETAGPGISNPPNRTASFLDFSSDLINWMMQRQRGVILNI